MTSRQDQLQSYQFTMQRVVAALVLRDANPGRSPFRRAAGATLASVVVAAIALGAVAIYGTVAGVAPADWRDGHAVIVERESGARFVYRGGALHAVPNYASALLIVGAGAPTVIVSREAIEGAPRGVPLGIAGAPDPLPEPRRLATGPWTVCSASGDRSPRPALLVGAPATGGAALADQALLAQHPDGAMHLIWQNRRHPLRDRELVLSALGWTDERPVTVAPALLDALPEGTALGRVPVPGAGGDSAVPGAEIGEVFVVATQGGARQYAVALRDGLAPITQVQADLLLTDLDQAEPTEMAQGDFADIPKLPGPDAAALPGTPRLASPSAGAVCAQVPAAAGVAELRIGAAVPGDAVVVEPGGGALVADRDAVWLVTDVGRRHAMSDPEVPALLGYADTPPLRVPAPLLALIPTAPALDRATASTPLAQ